MPSTRPSGMLRFGLLLAVFAAGGACKKKDPSPAPAVAAAPAPAKPAAAKARKPPADVDLSVLDEFERKVFDQVVQREPSACGKGHSLFHSYKNDTACRASFYAVRYVARLANAGLNDAEIGEKLEQRFRAPRVPFIDVAQAPRKGSAQGKVSVVEFADYTCHHCKEAQAFIPALLAEFPDDVTLYFKHFPLTGSVGGLNAAIGASAAQNQGKFWEFNDKVWPNYDRISPAVLEAIGNSIGLDFPRWYADLETEEVRSRVLRDRAEARGLGIPKTPAFFLNGRRYTDEPDLAGLTDWIEEELDK